MQSEPIRNALSNIRFSGDEFVYKNTYVFPYSSKEFITLVLWINHEDTEALGAQEENNWQTW